MMQDAEAPQQAKPGEDPPDTFGKGYNLLDECLARAEEPREGYWSIFSTLAWIVSQGDARFVAGTQLFEAEPHDNRAAFCAFVWGVIETRAADLFGRSFHFAEGLLREKLEAGRLQGGTAVDCRTNESVLVERHQWRIWDRAIGPNGVELIAGLRDHGWPSEAVREAFPAVEIPGKAAEPEQVVVVSTGAAIKECDPWLRSQFEDEETADWTKPRFRAAALAQFPGRLSGRGFDGVWSKVAKDYPARAKAGAKRKSPHLL